MHTGDTNNENDLIANHINELKQIEIEGYQLGVKKARNALFWVAALVFIAEMLSMLISDPGFNLYILIFALVIAGIFVGLAFWTKIKPYTALIAGLIAYIAYILLVVFVNGMADGAGGYFKAIFGGIIVKALIISILVRAIPDAKRLQEALKEKAI